MPIQPNTSEILPKFADIGQSGRRVGLPLELDDASLRATSDTAAIQANVQLSDGLLFLQHLRVRVSIISRSGKLNVFRILN